MTSIERQFAKIVYNKYCPNVVKDLLGRHRMFKHLVPLVWNLVLKWKENIVKARECVRYVYIPVITSDEESEEAEISIYFDETKFDWVGFYNLLQINGWDTRDSSEWPKEYDFSNLRYVKKGEKMIRQGHHIDELLVDDLNKCVMEIIDCINIDTTVHKLGYEHRPWYYTETQNTQAHKIIVEFVQYMLKNEPIPITL